MRRRCTTYGCAARVLIREAGSWERRGSWRQRRFWPGGRYERETAQGREGGTPSAVKETDNMRIVCTAILLILLVPCSARAQYGKTPDPKPPTPKQVQPEGPHASVVFAPTGARDPVDLPRDKMVEVLSEIDKGDSKEAGSELKKAVQAMQSAADTSLGEAIRSNVLRSVVELSSRAEGMHSGEKVTAEVLIPMFSRALQALAGHPDALAPAQFQSGHDL